jgi:hypothetical protein
MGKEKCCMKKTKESLRVTGDTGVGMVMDAQPFLMVIHMKVNISLTSDTVPEYIDGMTEECKLFIFCSTFYLLEPPW